jgi:hypothetical protein
MTGSVLNQKKVLSDGIRKLVGHWTKFIEKQDDYAEKLWKYECSEQINYLKKEQLWILFKCCHINDIQLNKS